MVAFNVETNKNYDDNENRFTFEIDIFDFSFIWINFIKTDYQQARTPTARVRIEQFQIMERPNTNYSRQTQSQNVCFIQERDYTNLISTTGSNGDAFIETEKEVAYFDPKIIIYNRVQKCGSRTILQAVRPILEFNKVAFEAKELKFYLTDEEQAQFRKDLGKVMTRPAI